MLSNTLGQKPFLTQPNHLFFFPGLGPRVTRNGQTASCQPSSTFAKHVPFNLTSIQNCPKWQPASALQPNLLSQNNEHKLG